VVAFFGIDRRLDITSHSIIEHIVNPAHKFFDVRLMGHLWHVRSLSNPRSGEEGQLTPPRLSLLPRGEYKIHPPLDLKYCSEFDKIRSFGDFWQDNFKSLANLYSQLISIYQVTEMALTLRPQCVIFVRPDLVYHDSLSNDLKSVQRYLDNIVLLPHWQPHHGLNDRFAICCGEHTIKAYGQRLQYVAEFCGSTGSQLHSEKLVHFALKKNNIKVQRIKARASRVRINGDIFPEDFSLVGWKPLLREFLGSIRIRLIRYIKYT
jgi:hypothetical protein